MTQYYVRLEADLLNPISASGGIVGITGLSAILTLYYNHPSEKDKTVKYGQWRLHNYCRGNSPTNSIKKIRVIYGEVEV